MKKIIISICILVYLPGCYKESDYSNSSSLLGIADLYTLAADKDSAAADGVSYIKLTIKGLPDMISDTDNVIMLKSDYGSFDGGTGKTATGHSSLVYDSVAKVLSRQFNISLISQLDVDSAHVTATIKGITKTIGLYYYRALPDTTRIIPASIYFKPSYSTGLSIEVDLIRDTGKVSLKTPVTLSLTDMNGNAAGSFQLYNNLTDSNGKCTFNYFLTDTLYQGSLRINLSTAGKNGTISNSTIINAY